MDAVISTIEYALAAAYRKDFGQKNQNSVVKFDPKEGFSKVYDIKTVVEDMPEESVDADIVADKKREEQIKKSKQVGVEKVDDKKGKKLIDGEPSAAEVMADEDEERKFNHKTEIQISDAKLLKKIVKIDDEIKTKLEVPDAYGRMAAQTAKQVIIQRLREAEREMIFNELKCKES